MDTDTLPAAPHTCTVECLVASQIECGCGVLGPGICDECAAFYAAHPDGEVSL